MNIIVEDPSYFNKKRGLEEGFLHCFQKLEEMVTGSFIPDILFQEVNVLRTKIPLDEHEAIVIRNLGDLLRDPNNDSHSIQFHVQNYSLICQRKPGHGKKMEYHAAKMHNYLKTGQIILK